MPARSATSTSSPRVASDQYASGCLRTRLAVLRNLLFHFFTFPLFPLSEGRSESELQHPRLVDEARVRNWQPIGRVALPHFVGPVVLVVEQVVRFEDARERDPSVDADSLLQAEIHSVD